MDNKEILKMLSALECVFYYRYAGSDDPQGVSYEDTRKMHEMINNALNEWHRLTGCVL